MDLSLDDYIVQNRNTRTPFKGRGGNSRARQQGRGNASNISGNTNQSMKFSNKRSSGGGANIGRLNTGRANTGRLNSGRIGKVNLSRPITDARQKIIQKNRQKLTDAREKLGELAKRTDARFKLEKLRVGRQVGRIPLPVGNSRPPGRRNNNQPQRRNLQVPLQHTIRKSVGTVVVPNAIDDMDVDMDFDINTPLQGASHVLRMTVPNEQANSRQHHLLNQQARSSTYTSWPTSQHQSQKEVHSVSKGYFDIDFSGDEVRKKSEMLSDRWTNHRVQPTITPSNPRVVPAPRKQGYRVVISNLHPSVIHEDIKELFEDVGPLLESRLDRPGRAEVVFKQLKDAEKAVESYHNRLLDRQPMKCVLMNDWRAASPTPPSHSASRGMVLARAGAKSGIKFSVVPDISTIHSALTTRYHCSRKYNTHIYEL